jgi:FkbM family methyltransferase
MYMGLKYKGFGYISQYGTHLHMRKHTKDYATFEEVFIHKIYDVELPFAPKTIIDAGSNIGLASLFFKWKYPDAKIVSFEIEDNNFELLQKNVAAYKDIKPVRKGIYSKNCFLTIHDPYKATNSYVVEETTQPVPGCIESVTVDAVLKENNWQMLDLLKMDIEGAEKEVFESDVAAWLPKTKAMMIEFHDRMRKGCAKAIFEAIRNYDFELITATDGTLVFVNEALVPFKRWSGQ